ncbi:MAG: ferrous iron transport protein A [Bacteroidia bacterium]|nr:ferrous iron transport protein A [Bacteroidia bacterium]
MLHSHTPTQLTSHTASHCESGLLSMQPGEYARIAKIDAPELEMALLKMGVSIGDEISFAGTAPLNDPVSIRVHRTKLLLRRDDASHIWINKG